MKLLAIGDNVVDCYLHQKTYYPGGNAVNVAVNCHRFGGDRTAYLGVFGTDQKAEHLQNCLKQEGVEFDRCRRLVGRSGAPLVNLVDGDRVFVRSRKDTAQHLVRLNLTKADLAYLGDFDLVHTSCFSYLESLLPEIARRCLVSYDFSTHQREDFYLRQVCPHLKFAFFSGADLTKSQQEALMDTCHAYGTEIVGITMGVKGSYFSHRGERFQHGIVPVEAVDTLGAGDAFISGFLTAYMNNQGQMLPALDEAAARGAAACAYSGGWGYGHAFDGDEEDPEL